MFKTFKQNKNKRTLSEQVGLFRLDGIFFYCNFQINLNISLGRKNPNPSFTSGKYWQKSDRHFPDQVVACLIIPKAPRTTDYGKNCIHQKACNGESFLITFFITPLAGVILIKLKQQIKTCSNLSRRIIFTFTSIKLNMNNKSNTNTVINTEKLVSPFAELSAILM